jgi:acetyl esterase
MAQATGITENMDQEQVVDDMRAQQDVSVAQRKVWVEHPTIGECFEVPREGKESVSTILYRPSQPMDGKPLPILFHMHGGAWIGGDAIFLESFCRLLSDEIPAVVVNINYKKADVHPLPYALYEVVDTVKYFRDHAQEYGIDATKMVVGGHSAGAHLAAGTALILKDEGLQLACQMLVYPATDLGDTSIELMSMVQTRLFPNGGWESSYMSPLRASEDELKGVAPAIFIICGSDDLRLQGISYAKRLIDLGIPVKVKEFLKAEHGFLEVNRPDYPQGDPRQNPEQAAYASECEQYLIRELKASLIL